VELSRRWPRRRVQTVVSRVTVCWKWVSVDGGDVDPRWSGVSPADEAALEVGLQLAGTDDVTVVCVGPAEADTVLRDALAAGAHHAVRINATTAASNDVAHAIAALAHDADLVVCGDYSLDRGTGSVPAYLAAHLGAAQALGLVHIDPSSSPLRVIRRLDGGRREVLDVPTPAVLSVEGSVARLRRAPLAAALRAKTAEIRVSPGPAAAEDMAQITAYRPRARQLPAPAGGTLARVRDILDIGAAEQTHAETVTLEPSDAAALVIEQLDEWGYLGEQPTD
jgi:electron transfer flavoprotein beta subunit